MYIIYERIQLDLSTCTYVRVLLEEQFLSGNVIKINSI